MPVVIVCVIIIALAVAPMALINLTRLVEWVLTGVLYVVGIAFPIWFFGSLFFWGF